MNCKGVQSRLSAFVDRELVPDEMTLVRAHLANCEECCQEELDLRCLKALLSDISAPDPSPDFESRLLRSIHRPRGRVSIWRLGGSAVVFACVAILSMAITLQYLSSARTVVDSGPNYQDVTADVQRDQVYQAGLNDPLYGAPVVTSADYGR